MKTLLLLSLAAVLPLLCVSVSAHAQETEFQVLTYNIRYLNTSDGADVWSHRAAAVSRTLATADIVGLQEVVGEQLNDIRDATPEHEWYGVGRDDGQQGGEMTAIGWRKSRFSAEDRGTFWLSETPEKVASRGWDAALPRIASWVKLLDRSTGQKLLMVNTHFDHRGSQARENSGKLLRDWIAKHRGELRVVLTGDLNAQLNDPPLQALLADIPQASPPLTDARAIAAVADSGPNSTWNGFQKIVDGRRIDFILLAGDFEVQRVTTLDPKTEQGRFASDHLPVLATLK